MPKVLLIDVDDTLLSFQQYVRESMIRGFEAFGIGPFREEMLTAFHQVNSVLWHKLEEGALSFEELKKVRWNQVFEAIEIKADGEKFEEFFRDYLFDSAIPEEGAKELLAYLKEKYILCAASNGPYHQQVNRLKKGSMLPYFSHLFISEEIGFSKPSREFFDVCLQRLNRKAETPYLPSDLMIIGDSVNSDMAGGIGAGLQTLFYNAKGQALPAEIKPDFTVSSLNEIKNIL
ncbi:MAG: YjjG family noncanonical pyrimidine nucleotidase [Clostridia bacterium]|nr:YjjG family noncanonical pyrimidine nucleotidase [Clostridia bacterium]